MFKKLFITASLVALSFTASASRITSRNLETSYATHDQELIEAMQKDVQELTSKVEVLEHVVKQLQEQLTLLRSNNMIQQEPVVNQDTPSATSVTEGTQIKESNSLATPAKPQTVVAGGSEKQQYDLALAALKSNNYEEAKNRFSNFITQHPNSALLSNAMFWYGESFSRSKMPEKAALYYLKSYKQSPKGAKAADALLKLASALGDLKKNGEACGMLNKLDNEFPNRQPASVKRSEELRQKLRCKN